GGVGVVAPHHLVLGQPGVVALSLVVVALTRTPGGAALAALDAAGSAPADTGCPSVLPGHVRARATARAGGAQVAGRRPPAGLGRVGRGRLGDQAAGRHAGAGQAGGEASGRGAGQRAELAGERAARREAARADRAGSGDRATGAEQRGARVVGRGVGAHEADRLAGARAGTVDGAGGQAALAGLAGAGR